MAHNRKKVLFVVTKSGMGGASRYVFEVAQALKNSHIAVVAAGGAGELFRQCERAGIRAVSIPRLGRDIAVMNEYRVFFSLLSLFRKEKPNVVHLNSPKVGGLGAVAARLSGVPRIVYTAHGWAFFEDVPWWNRALRKFFSYLTVLLAHKTIAVSKKDAHAFDGWPLAKKRIVYIPNGTAVRSIISRAEARRKLLSSDTSLDNNFLISAIGELHKNKGHSFLIEAAKEIPGASFVVIGEGEERERLEVLIKKDTLENRVRFLGYMPSATDYLKAFDVFVMPSVKEGLPYALLEAGAQGLPVVASSVGGIPDIIEHEKTGLLVPPKNPAALARALARLQKDPVLRKRLASALKQKIERDFSLDSMVRKTLELYG